MRGQLVFEGPQFALGRKMAVEQQMSDLFETGARGKVVDVVSAIGETAFFALDVAEERAPYDDAFKPAIDDDTSGRQCGILRSAFLPAAVVNPWTATWERRSGVERMSADRNTKQAAMPER
jgi:hypothetical protein